MQNGGSTFDELWANFESYVVQNALMPSAGTLAEFKEYARLRGQDVIVVGPELGIPAGSLTFGTPEQAQTAKGLFMQMVS